MLYFFLMLMLILVLILIITLILVLMLMLLILILISMFWRIAFCLLMKIFVLGVMILIITKAIARKSIFDPRNALGARMSIDLDTGVVSDHLLLP